MSVADRVAIVVDWDDPRAVALRAAMDDELGLRYADRIASRTEDELARFGSALAVDPATIVATVLVFDDAGGAAEPVGHAALRDLGPVVGDALEVKRVVVLPQARGRGVGRRLMGELETIAAARGAGRLVLQTGDRQPEAVALYERIGYRPIDVYPPYLDVPWSRCFEKPLPSAARS